MERENKLALNAEKMKRRNEDEMATDTMSKLQVDLSPRSKFAIERSEGENFIIELLMLLDIRRVLALRKRFQKNSHHSDIAALNLNQFVRACMDVIPDFMKDDDVNTNANRLTPLRGFLTMEEYARFLSELFQDIDANGDGDVDWDEFTKYMISKSMHKNSMAEREESRFEQLQNKSKQGYYHRKPLHTIKYIKPQHTLVTLETDAALLSFYNATSGDWVKNYKTKGKIPLATEYVDSANALIVNFMDKTMTRYNFVPGGAITESNSWRVSQMQTCLFWVEKHKILYSGSVAGSIHAWNLEKQRDQEYAKGHSDSITCLYNMKSLDNLVSGGHDKIISIWDNFTGAKRQELRGHTHGVIALSYNPEYRLLISAASEHDPLVWSPFVSTNIRSLKGHKHPLLAAKCVPDSMNIITADIGGFAKVWDIRNFNCIQTFTSTSGMKNLAAFEVFNSTNGLETRVVGATKQVIHFKRGEKNAEPVTSDQPIRFVAYSSCFFTILSVAGNTIRLWDAIKGNMKKSFTNVTQTDITAICLDQRQRRFFTGESDGTIKAFSFQYATCLRVFTSHNAEVFSLHYCALAKELVSASRDYKVRVHSDKTAKSDYTINRTLDPAGGHVNGLGCVDVTDDESVLAAGWSSGHVTFWDLSTGKYDYTIECHGPVVLMTFLAPYKYLLVSTALGIIELHCIQGSVYETQQLFMFSSCVYDGPEKFRSLIAHPVTAGIEFNAESPPGLQDRSYYKENGAIVPVNPMPSRVGKQPATSMIWTYQQHRLYVGSEDGILYCFSLKKLLTVIEPTLQQVAGKFKEGKSKSTVLLPAPIERIEKEAATALELEWTRQAHSHAISDMLILNDFNCIGSSSYDRCVNGWTQHGERVGTLLQQTSALLKNQDWDVPFDVAKYASKEEEHTASLVAVVLADENENSEERKSSLNEATIAAVAVQDTNIGESVQRSDMSHFLDDEPELVPETSPKRFAMPITKKLSRHSSHYEIKNSNHVESDPSSHGLVKLQSSASCRLLRRTSSAIIAANRVSIVDSLTTKIPDIRKTSIQKSADKLANALEALEDRDLDHSIEELRNLRTKSGRKFR